MKMIVGLGNPGREYDKTRHNIGFMIIDKFSCLYKGMWKEKFGALYQSVHIDDQSFLLVKPQEYMNLSGQSIKKIMDYFKIESNEVLIIHDDLDLPLGKIRLRCKGSSGGHNGLKNIELHLKSQSYNRLKVGISNDQTIPTRDYVLAKFSKEEMEILEKSISTCVHILKDYLILDFDQLMNQYNKK